jgi:hypothetical protein
VDCSCSRFGALHHEAPEAEVAPIGPEARIPVDRHVPPQVRLAAPYFAVACLLAIPCVWQQHIVASDLSSHLYNAWLANRVAAGALRGLSVVPQYSNVLFDLLLSWLLKSCSVVLTERIAVISAVQVFFWGCFALVSATGGRPAWGRAPLLALLAYGAVFRMGFFNFYISVGICCGAIALVWWNGSRARWLALALLPVACTAHFMPCLLAVAVIGYILAARWMRPSHRWRLLAAGLIGIGGLAAFLATRAPSSWSPGIRVESFFGADQVVTFGLKYNIVAAGLLCWFILLMVRRFELAARPPLHDIVLHLWLLMAVAAVSLPDSIWLPPYTGRTYITLRLSLLSAILLCASVARVPLKAFERIGHIVLIAVFFSFSYADERALNLVEQKVARAVAALPPGSRVISTLTDSRLYVQALQHVVDRPCIGRCFDFADYEPSTGKFRLRAQPGNSFVISDYAEVGNLERGQFVFKRPDIAVYRLFSCEAGREICADRVSPGQRLMEDDLAPETRQRPAMEARGVRVGH